MAGKIHWSAQISVLAKHKDGLTCLEKKIKIFTSPIGLAQGWIHLS